MNRRNVLIGAGSIGAATVGLAAFAGGAAAEIDSEFTAEEEGISGESDDGDVESVLVEVSGEYSFTGLDSNAEGVELTLEAGVDDDLEEVDTKTLDSDEVPYAQSVDGEDFGMLSGDLVELDQFNSEDFSAGEGDDPETDKTNYSDVDLQLTIEVEYGDDESVADESDTDLEVAMTNLGAQSGTDAEVGGEIGTSHHVGTSDDGVLDVRAVYGEESLIYTVTLGDGWPVDGDAANFNLNFDIGGAGDAEDYQVGWHATGEGELDAGGFVKVADGSNRTLHHADETGGAVDVEEVSESEEYVVTIDTSSLTVPDEYGFAGYASSGGGAPVHAVTTDGEAPDWESASNFFTVPVEE